MNKPSTTGSHEPNDFQGGNPLDDPRDQFGTMIREIIIELDRIKIPQKPISALIDHLTTPESRTGSPANTYANIVSIYRRINHLPKDNTLADKFRQKYPGW